MTKPTLLALALIAAPTAAHAELISRDWLAPGDGLLTFDPVARLEWLDVTETLVNDFPEQRIEDRFQSIVAETAPGGQFEGFRVANSSEAEQLAVTAGVVLGTSDFETNREAVQRVIDSIGATGTRGNGAPYAGVLLSESEVANSRNGPLIRRQQIGATVDPDSSSLGTAHFVVFTNFGVHEPDTGDGALAVALVRHAVPEPTSVIHAMLLAAALSGVAGAAAKRSPQRTTGTASVC